LEDFYNEWNRLRYLGCRTKFRGERTNNSSLTAASCSDERSCKEKKYSIPASIFQNKRMIAQSVKILVHLFQSKGLTTLLLYDQGEAVNIISFNPIHKYPPQHQH
jgi:hypothetical protein